MVMTSGRAVFQSRQLAGLKPVSSQLSTGTMPHLYSATAPSHISPFSLIPSNNPFNSLSLTTSTFLIQQKYLCQYSISHFSLIVHVNGCCPPFHRINRFGSLYVILTDGLAAKKIGRIISSGQCVCSAHVRSIFILSE